MRIAVIHTGSPDDVLRRTPTSREWEGYRQNASDITAALSALGHEAVQLPDGRTLIEQLTAFQPDMSWICSGGIQGRDPATHLPAMLEMLGLAYVGSGPLAAGTADNKARAKTIVRDARVATPDFTVVRADATSVPAVSEFPVMVKPICGMCSCGVYKAGTMPELQQAVTALRHSYGDDVLVEQFVAGIDVTIGLVEAAGVVRCLPPLQRFFGERDDPRFGHYSLPHPQARLREGPPVPAMLQPDQHAALLEAAKSAWSSLGLRHFARLDFRIADSAIWFLEANHKPDLTRSSLMVMAADLAGLAYHDLIRQILASASRPPAIRAVSM